MPMTCQVLFRSGPPQLPGLMTALLWSGVGTLASTALGFCRTAEMTPVLTLDSSPKGFADSDGFLAHQHGSRVAQEERLEQAGRGLHLDHCQVKQGSLMLGKQDSILTK